MSSIEKLKEVGLTDEEISDMIGKNPAIKDMDDKDMSEKLRFLMMLGCNDRIMEGILTGNPMFLTRSMDEINALTDRLRQIGIVDLFSAFDADPNLLSKEVIEVDDFLYRNMYEGSSVEEIADLIREGLIDDPYV